MAPSISPSGFVNDMSIVVLVIKHIKTHSAKHCGLSMNETIFYCPLVGLINSSFNISFKSPAKSNCNASLNKTQSDF